MNNKIIEVNTVEDFDCLTEREQMIAYITNFRLFLYHRELPCGPKAIQEKLRKENLNPPSISTIARALKTQSFTHKRTGYYEGENY